MEEVYAAANKELKSNKDFVIASVVRTSGSTPQKPGAKLLVREDGSGVGTLGGGCVEGDIWYNAGTGKLKMYAALNAWASSNNMNTARSAHGAAGTQTAGITFSGNGPPPGHTADTETYDGSSWTQVNDVNDLSLIHI